LGQIILLGCRRIALPKSKGVTLGILAHREITHLWHGRFRHADFAAELRNLIGELEMRLNNREAAAEQFRKAFELAETKSERAFLLKRLQHCVDGG